MAQSEFSLSRMTRREFLKVIGGGVGLAMSGGLLAACAPSPTSAPPPTQAVVAPTAAAVPTAAPAKVSGKLSVYSALNETTNNEFVKAFKAANPGVEVDLLPMAAAGELQTRIRTEKNSPKADVFIGGSSEFHDPLGKEGLLEAYKSPNAATVDAEFKEASGLWTGWYIGIFGFLYNTDRFAKEMANVKKPTTWDDLLDPAWKGKLVYPDPIKTGGGYIFMATQLFRFSKDEDKTMEYMKKLHANVAQYTGTATQVIQLVSQGQFVGGLNWAHDILTNKNQGLPVELIVPEMTGFEIGAVSIVKGGPNLPAAKAFVDWVLTPEAGALNVKLSNRLSVRKEAPPAAGAPTLDQVKLVKYERQWASDNKERILKKWQAAVGM